MIFIVTYVLVLVLVLCKRIILTRQYYKAVRFFLQISVAENDNNSFCLERLAYFVCFFFYSFSDGDYIKSAVGKHTNTNAARSEAPMFVHDCVSTDGVYHDRSRMVSAWRKQQQQHPL